MTAQNPGGFFQNLTGHGAELFRRATFAAFANEGGVVGKLNGNSDLAVTAPASGMTVNVALGEVLVPGSTTTTQGLYYGLNDGTVSVAVSAADASLTRIDTIAAKVQDSAYAGAVDSWSLVAVTGTAGSGVAPSLPASSLGLANLTIPHSVSSIISGYITDTRIFASAANSRVGEVTWWAGPPPPNTLVCDGAAVSRSTYAKLYGKISTTWGVGNGSTTFNVPDLRGRVAIGVGQGAGLTNRLLAGTGGEENHALSVGELASHAHTPDAAMAAGVGSGASTEGLQGAGHTGTAVYPTWGPNPTTATGSGTAHNTMQPWRALNCVIFTH